MKKILLILTIAVWTNSVQSQEVIPLSFTGIEQLDSSVTAEQVFDRAKRWLADAFVSSTAVTEIADKNNGEIVGKGNFDLNFIFMGGASIGKGAVTFKIRIWVKDLRYKYEFYNFTQKSYDTNYPSYGLVTNNPEEPGVSWPMVSKTWKNKYWRDLQHDSHVKAKNLIESMKVFMQQKTENTDW